MMLWSDNITIVPGEICLVKCSVLWQPTQFRVEKKKIFLTFQKQQMCAWKKPVKKKK